MSAPVSERMSPWRANCPEEECSPIGPLDSGLAAVIDLGPFEYSTRHEADARPCHDRIRRMVSKESACDRVYALAQSYRSRVILNNGAPRRKDFLEKLDKLEQVAGELARLVSGLDDMAIHYIQTAGSGITGHREYFPTAVMKEADVDGLPQVGEDSRTCAWVRRLSALSQYVNATRTTFLISKNVESGDEPADKGGNTSLYKEIYGPPNWYLVQEGWHIYDLFKPDQATGHVDGPFHGFLKHVFEFATGLEPEEHSKLAFWLKKLCKLNREMKELRLRENELGLELNRLTPIVDQAREVEIYAEHDRIDRRMAVLWPQIYPSR
jgi:hypothetical protein